MSAPFTSGPTGVAPPQGKILIDTGRSRRGWSRISDAFRCYQLFAYGDSEGCLNLVSGFETRDALIMGSLGHVGAAHYYRRMQASQEGDDPERWYAPLEAMMQYAVRHPEAQSHLSVMMEVVSAYIQDPDYSDVPGRILEVEGEHFVVVGWRHRGDGAEPDWGIWYLGGEGLGPDGRPEVDEAALQPGGPAWVYSRYAGWVYPYRLQGPGHPKHGLAAYYTRRLDLMLQVPVWIESWDHKFKSFVGDRTADEYLMDGQFTLARVITEQRYAWREGRHDRAVKTRVKLNAVRRAGAFCVLRPVMPAVEADVSFAVDLIEREEQTMRWQVAGRNPWFWQRARHEQVCRSAYGTCSAYKLCRYGTNARVLGGG